MSIDDNYIIKRWKDSESWYILRGRETFYDKEDYLRLFDSPAEAVDWIQENMKIINIDITIQIRDNP